MKLHRLRVANFAGVREADINFGEGLNVLYGPNDLGKSTLVDAIRLALLLPHSSTSSEQYLAWTGGREPVVELTFETEQHRIWRVRKEFGKGGSSLLQESKNGRDFDDVERARKVDGKLREILGWGIPEPGGSGGSKGLPTSFLATALLSTQSDVAALLNETLQNDPTASGRERIAAALQAVAQDPLFVSLLRSVQARRDEAYTDKGAKKTAKGSVFKVAADRVKETRDEKERFQRIVADSEGAETLLRDLLQKRDEKRESLETAAEQVALLEQLATQAANCSAAAELVRCADEEVERILTISRDIEEGETKAKSLLSQVEEARGAIAIAQNKHAEAELAFREAEEAAREGGSDPSVNETVVRQELELHAAAADRAASIAQQNIDTGGSAKQLVDAASEAERGYREQEKAARTAREKSAQDAERETLATSQLLRCDLLERALDVRLADKRVADAQAAVQKRTNIQERLDRVSVERAALIENRSTMRLPQSAALTSMRRLANDLAAARGALNVGLVVTIEPVKHLDLRIQRDGMSIGPTSAEQPVEVEASTEVEVGIPEVATLRIRGGRRDARDTVRALEQRWDQEVMPHLTAAAVADLDGLDSKLSEALKLDAQIKETANEFDALRMQAAAFAEAAGELQEAVKHATTCRAALGDVPFETLAADLELLGVDPVQGLRTRRLELSKNADTARLRAGESSRFYTVAEERTTNLRSTWEAAISRRDVALASFPKGLDATLAAAQADLSRAKADKQQVVADLEALERTISSRKQRIDVACNNARTQVDMAKSLVETAQEKLNTAITNHAEHVGRLAELRRRRDAENLQEAEANLHDAKVRRDALSFPERMVTKDEVETAKADERTARSEFEAHEREIQRAHGALQQVGGAVARDRLRDATEAYEIAERTEKEIEADYEAWKLLLDQMKEADSAQASNLGQALAPSITGLFRALTQQRYQSVHLGAQLDTEGVVVHGAPRPTARLSVGTREQLSTLYRLALAEYLGATVVLDDQLVQTDGHRMDWFRALLTEKAHGFQIIVFTCRPSDYIPVAAMVPEGKMVHMDTCEGFIRSIDLERTLRMDR
jgi:hypothetical protein